MVVSSVGRKITLAECHAAQSSMMYLLVLHHRYPVRENPFENTRLLIQAGNRTGATLHTAAVICAAEMKSGSRRRHRRAENKRVCPPQVPENHPLTAHPESLIIDTASLAAWQLLELCQPSPQAVPEQAACRAIQLPSSNREEEDESGNTCRKHSKEKERHKDKAQRIWNIEERGAVFAIHCRTNVYITIHFKDVGGGTG
ncbi:hypothetical protein CDAR_480151 [Caerostris darwini]|uniref:Uncharacterized protein n=1 Tax=Caerostris darwini TaxID=1538125 RepID=A0AAV4V083_9ARAC|nr:hypothetical protein CDAR_480151 [Caerostris darwini]